MVERVLVLYGGWSVEREVSLTSGEECATALSQAGFTVEKYDVTADPRQLLDAIDPTDGPAPDVIFNALHGRGGEDGVVQGLLEMVGRPYTHSGVLASALAMDKPLAKTVFQAGGIKVPTGTVLARKDLSSNDLMPAPFVIKPAEEGSSVGVEIVREGDNRPAAYASSEGDPEDRLLVEEFIPGRELTVGVMGDRALTVTEIKPRSGFYDYRAKYTDGVADHIIPAEIPPDVFELCLSQATEAYRQLGCHGVSRADFRFDDTKPGTDGLYMLEVNTQPGMTPLSLVPEQAAHCGIDFAELCRWMVENARCPN
ncbi:MAG: D-alanine--D-alanine ligase [Pseudomonadota bacterium]